MNIVLIMLDSLRADHVGAYGNRWIQTPALDALAAEGIVFTRAYNGAIPTIPVRRTFPFRDYRRLRGIDIPVIGWQPVPEEHSTIAELLGGHGYITAFLTSTAPYLEPNMNFHRGFGQAVFFQGHDGSLTGSAYVGSQLGVGRFLTPAMVGSREEVLLQRFWSEAHRWRDEEDFLAPRLFQAAARWVEEHQGAEPFFLFIDCFDPHEPWYVPQKYVDLYDAGHDGPEMVMPLYGATTYLSERELQNMRAHYAASVTMVDAWFGRFFATLRERGLMDRTLIIVTSDHGHLLGEHGVSGKLPHALYPELVHVPLIVRSPDGAGGGARPDVWVGDHDVPATVLAAAGVEPDFPLDGADLRRLAADPGSAGRDHAVCAFGSVRGTYVWVSDGEDALIVRANGEEPRLYHVRDDPEHFHDVAPGNEKAVRRLYELALADAGGKIYEALADPRRSQPWAGA